MKRLIKSQNPSLLGGGWGLVSFACGIFCCVNIVTQNLATRNDFSKLVRGGLNENHT